jgi:hypothetical protein
MPIHETFSKRQQRLASAGKPVLYQYYKLPEAFRVQVIHIWQSALGAHENLILALQRMKLLTSYGS